MEFKEGEKEHFVEIEILYDGQREMREAFTVHMKPDENMVAEIQVRLRPHANKYKPVAGHICVHVQYCISTHVSMRSVMSACVKIARQQLALLSARLNHSVL